MVHRWSGQEDKVDLLIDLNTNAIEEALVSHEETYWYRNLLQCILVRGQSIYLSRWGDSKIYFYDVFGNELLSPFDLASVIR